MKEEENAQNKVIRYLGIHQDSDERGNILEQIQYQNERNTESVNIVQILSNREVDLK